MEHDRYHELSTAIDASLGYKIECQLREIWVSHRVYQLNFLELAKVLAEGTNFRLAISKYHQSYNKPKDDSAFVEVVRLLHNYVAGVKSLVDHTRIVATGLLQQEYIRTYQNRVKSDFIDDSSSRFLQDLRNYLLHCGHLPVVAVFKFADGHGSDRQSSSSIVLATKKASVWDGWNEKSREFLANNGPDIQLLSTIKEYDQKVYRFYEWLLKYVREVFKDDVAQFDALQDELREFYREAGILGC